MALRRLLKGKSKDAKGPFEDGRHLRHQEHEAGAEGEGDHDESNWLVSYADMMTLLCGFFIMLFSMAKLDEPQYERVKEAVAKQFGGEYKSATAELGKFMTEIIDQNGLTRNTVVRIDPS